MRHRNLTSSLLLVATSVFGLSPSAVIAQQLPFLVATVELPAPAAIPTSAGLATNCDSSPSADPALAAGAMQGSCPVITNFYVQYRAFIPADHLNTTVPCYLGQQQASPIPSVNSVPYNVPLGFVGVLGDASSFATHFRIKEYALLAISAAGPMPQSAVIPVPSISDNFEIPSSPLMGNTITSGDFNPPPLLLKCYHEQSTDSAILANEGGSANSTAANQATVSFTGSATDPLFTNPVAPIQYNLNVSIDTQTNMATITGSHTCFPSHEIEITRNNVPQILYRKNPSSINFAQLSYCLIGAMMGATETKVNCTVPLDGISTCP